MAVVTSRRSHRGVAHVLRSLLCSALVLGSVACGSAKSTTASAADAGVGAPGSDGSVAGDAGPAGSDATASGRFALAPASSTLTLTREPFQTLTFVLNADGQAVAGAHFTLNRTDLGTIDRDSGLFTPSGVAGVLVVTASSADGSATSTLDIAVNLVHEGDPGRDDLTAGAGGVGGVGGEGGGTPITDADVRAALDTPPAVDAQLRWLYPYDGTVFPRGIPAPLLSWRSGSNTPVAVRVHVEVDDKYTYDGYFGPPTALAAGRALTHLPLPQSIWRAALLSGSTMRITIVVAARGAGGVVAAYQPASNLTWTIAPGSLKGTVYYNSYGTKLAENFNGARGGNGRFGGATLAVRGDSYEPRLIAGTTTQDSSGCRVCHTVSGNGGLLMVQGDPNTRTSAYDLSNMNTERMLPTTDNNKFAWAALSPDGRIALGNSGPPGSNPAAVVNLAQTRLYDVATGGTLTANGLNAFVTRAAMPTFSPDGSQVAFNFFAGPGQPGLVGDGKSLVVMDVARNDPSTYTFSNPRGVFTATNSAAPGWPSFLPDASGLVFQRELAAGSDNEHFMTRNGARGELWWTDLDGHAHALDNANGSMGLPTSASHPADQTLNYEPAVGPIVAGGYAWVVFTSRRAYGDVATRAPFESDPRDYDLTANNAQGPTTKKLWVVAIDMPATPGTDPSHPAFYLPAQELFAGNSRGFWVPDVCKATGTGCASGDECCGGYCRRLTEFGEPVCEDSLPPATCANEYEACETEDDCCAGGAPLSCVGGRCAQVLVR